MMIDVTLIKKCAEKNQMFNSVIFQYQTYKLSIDSKMILQKCTTSNT